jgi:hypothetical protein
MFQKLFISFLLLLCSLASFAEPLKLVSPGSQTGGYTIQLTAYAKDLSKEYDVSIVSAGNLCEALKQTKDSSPVLILWGNDYESQYRQGACEGISNPLSMQNMVRSHVNAYTVCSMNKKKQEFLIKGTTGKIAHSVPKSMFATVIDEINSAAAVNYSAIPYNGQGQTRLALVSGEVDYAILPNEQIPFIEQKGGSCFYMVGDTENHYPQVDNLQNMFPNKNMTISLMHGMFILNADTTTKAKLVGKLKELHSDCSSSISTHTKCGKDLKPNWNINSDVKAKWETNVARFGK